MKGSSRAGARLAGLAGVAFVIVAGACTERAPALARSSGNDVREFITTGADSLSAALSELRRTPLDSANTAVIQTQFLRARRYYKHLEGAVEFYAPALAAAFNSRRMEVDDDDAPPPSTLGPSGFPALEEFVWPPNAAKQDSAQQLIDGMQVLAARVKSMASALAPTDAQIIELTRLELARVSTMGIAGFDTPRTHEAMRESADALDGVRLLYALCAARWPTLSVQRRSLDTSLARAAQYLRANTDFMAFNRLAYLVGYGEPAARALDSLRRAGKTVPIRMPRAFRANVASPYEAHAFDARAYAPLTAPPSSPELVALGRRLFMDAALSGTHTRSCASCHDPARSFTDGVAKAASIDTHGASVSRNTPTLVNAGLQPSQFADERAVALEDQIVEVLRSPAEMASSIEIATRAIAANESYRPEFANAFSPATADAVTQLRVRQALAAYVRSLVGLDSRFDKAVRGDTAQLTAQERTGFSVFMGKAGCGTCHFAPLFNGNTPPRFMGSDVEVIGTPATPNDARKPDADSGRARIDHLPQHVRAFKVPTLRNIALTAPYMHHGAFATLDQVVRFYDGGGGRGAGARITNQTLPADSLRLSPAEQAAIVAFLGTLTDTIRRR